VACGDCGALLAVGNQITNLATGIARLHRGLSERTLVQIGLPVLDEFYSTCLQLEGSDQEELALDQKPASPYT
jgi:hypothetical protein